MSRRLRRRVRRGDFPTQVEEESRFPSLSWDLDVDRWRETLRKIPACNPDASEEEESDLPLALIARVERAKRERGDGAGCLAAMEWLTDQQQRRFNSDDRRKIVGPTPAQVASGEEDEQYARLDVLDKAKRHFDRARQLYATGRSNIYNGLINNHRRQIEKGERAIWAVEEPGSQLPRRDRKSALWELWQGYRWVRTFEMSPPPPLVRNTLTASWEVNPTRVVLDAKYVFLMGSLTLTPNRLDIGPAARRVWTRAGQNDPHQPWLVDRLPSSRLYGEANHDPQVSPLREITDVARALFFLHSNFPPPRNSFSSAARTLAAASEPASSLSASPYATPGQPYATPAEWPFPSDEIPFDPNYVPVYFPSGRRTRSEHPVSHFDLIEPTPWYLEPEMTFRLTWDSYGSFESWPPPRSLVLPPIWDARMSVALLFSREAALKQRNFFLSQFRLPRTWTHPSASSGETGNEGGEEEDLEESNTLREWPSGPVAFARSVRVAPRLPGTVNQRSRTLEPPRSGGSALTIQDWQLGNQNSTFLPQGTLIDSTDQARRAQTLIRFPFGASSTQLPQITDWDALPADRERQMAMLQHALWQLDAPLTPWMREHLRPEFWPAPSLRGDLDENPAGSVGEEGEEGNVEVSLFANSRPGHGLRGREDPSLVGWSQLGNPFLQEPLGGVRGRRWYRDLQPRWPRQLRYDNVAVGPLCLSPFFASDAWYRDHWHQALCDLWVVRTNQQRVFGQNTWGLDFVSQPFLSQISSEASPSPPET